MIEDSIQILVEDAEVMEVVLGISFHTISITDDPRKIWIFGKLKNILIFILIDRGNTHNFVDQSILSKYRVAVEGNRKFNVMVANKEQVECAG